MRQSEIAESLNEGRDFENSGSSRNSGSSLDLGCETAPDNYYSTDPCCGGGIYLALGFIISLTPALFISLGINLVAVMLTFYMVRLLFSDYFQERYGKKKMIRRINKRLKAVPYEN